MGYGVWGLGFGVEVWSSEFGIWGSDLVMVVDAEPRLSPLVEINP